MSQYVRSSHHAAKRLPSGVEKKKKANVIHKNMRASRIDQKLNFLTDEVSVIVYSQLHRVQLLNQIAHKERLPVVKIRKSKLFASVRKRLKMEQKKLYDEFCELLQDKPRFI